MNDEIPVNVDYYGHFGLRAGAESSDDKDALREWAASTGPYEHSVWVGDNVSVADVKRWVRVVESSDREDA